MRYLMMICTDENEDATFTPDEQAAHYGKYGVFMEEMNARGALLGGERLRPTTTATTVQVRDGATLTTDGPFAETKEQVGGFYLVECKDLDEAIEVAAKIPDAQRGAIEVRPIWEM
jgi:hypothetical protein